MLDIFQSTALRIPQKWPAGFARNSHKPLETYVFLERRGFLDASRISLRLRTLFVASSKTLFRCLEEGSWDLVGNGSR
jgi:hypothetical protein